MSEESDLLNEYLDKLPDPLKQAVRFAFQNDFGANVKAIGKRHNLDDNLNDAFLMECMLVVVGINEIDELRDILIAELDVSYEQAVRLKHGFEMDVLLSIAEDAKLRGFDVDMLESPQLPTTEHRWEICKITFEVIRKTGWLHAGEICWLARATGPTGTYAAGRSGKFWVPNVSSDGGVTMPGEELAQKLAVPALHSLVSELLREGWEPADNNGNDWWEMQFKRPTS